MKINEPLRQALSDSGVSAAELARRMGVSKSYISQLTSGKLGVSEATLTTIADKLNCKVHITVTFEKV